MPNVAGATTGFFPTAKEGFTTTLSGTASSGAATVGLNSVAGYNDGDYVVLVVDPTDSNKKQAFTGKIDVPGSQVTGVTWTEGTDQAHLSGATVVDYETATHWAMYRKGLLVSHQENGKLKTAAVQEALNTTQTSSPDYTVLAQVPEVVTTNGNRSFDIKFTGVDYTDRLSAGQKLRIARTGTTPTQSTDLNGTTQYASKTSPTGITFTDDFTCEAWIKMRAYGEDGIISRYNGTSGWLFSTMADGTLRIFMKNAGASDFYVTNVSISLNKWTHVAASLDASASTAKIYIDGVEVTGDYTNSAATALVQAGDLQIGAFNGAGNFFEGTISDVRLWNAIRTQAQIRDNMNQQLVGNETNLVGYWKLNGDFNDSTSNANNLTAAGSATATYADNPFNANAYAIIMSTPVFASGDTTMTVQTPTGYPIPNQILGTASYSSVKAPYGFPTEPEKWSLVSLLAVETTRTIGALGTYYTMDNYGLSVPAGAWEIGYDVVFGQSQTSAGIQAYRLTLSTSTTLETDGELTTGAINRTSSTSASYLQQQRTKNISQSLQTMWYFLGQSETGSGTVTIRIGATYGINKITAECAYL